jgi:GntR family transcriptional regulator of gluconate operon
VSTRLAEVRRPQLWQEVASELRRAILVRRLQPGTHLAESELSREMGVSRGPIRDALRQLELESLVEIRRNGRAQVTGLSHESIANLYDARLCLELYAMQRASERLTDSDVDQLQELVDEMENYTRQARVAEFSQIDTEFHQQFFAIAGNRVLAQLRQALTAPLSTLVELEILTVLERSGITDPRAWEVNQGHQTMVDALRRRDIPAAQQALTVHLEGAQNLLLGELAQQHLL